MPPSIAPRERETLINKALKVRRQLVAIERSWRGRCALQHHDETSVRLYRELEQQLRALDRQLYGSNPR